MKKYFVLLALCFSVCSFAQIINIPDANFKAKLIDSGFDLNSDGEIQDSEALVVDGINVANSTISDLTGIEAFANILLLDCSGNQLTQLDMSGRTQLITLYCNNNQISDLNITNCPNLDNLNCSNNLLTSIDFSGVNSFNFFHCSYNSITNFNFTNLVVFNDFFAHHNLIANLDLSMVNISGIGEFSYNPLQTINIKNGFSENLLFNFFFSPPNPALQYVCADDNEIVTVNNYLNLNGITGVVVNTYCSFVPGGNFNTITGTIKYDQVGDGCDGTDNALPFVLFGVQGPTNQAEVSSNALGEYAAYAMLGDYLVTPVIENPSWFTITPENATVSFTDIANNVVNQNFCVTPNDIHADAAIVITPLNQPVPGSTVMYQIVFRNKGTQPLFGVTSLSYDDVALDFVSSTVLPDTQIGGQLDWNYIDLLPFESRSFLITFNVGNFVAIDYVLQLTAQITTSLTDEIPSDNQFLYKHDVVSFSNSNTTTCLQGEIAPVTLIGEYLDYCVEFENTGLAQIENAVIKFQIDPTMFDANSMQIQEATDNAFLRKNGNVVEVILQQVNIDTGGHGNVLLKIKTQPTLQEGDSVINTANIYFDYNAPIITNEAETTFQILNNPSFPSDESITIFPNPTASIVNINCNNTIKKVELYDVQGRLLQTQIVNSATTSLDVSNKTNGIYFAKITSEKGVKVEKISKE